MKVKVQQLLLSFRMFVEGTTSRSRQIMLHVGRLPGSDTGAGDLMADFAASSAFRAFHVLSDIFLPPIVCTDHTVYRTWIKFKNFIADHVRLRRGTTPGRPTYQAFQGMYIYSFPYTQLMFSVASITQRHAQGGILDPCICAIAY